MKKLKHKIHVVSTTHWDREWRFTFEETRIMLIKMIDHLIKVFETNPKYKYYHLDGQTIPLEDYLEIHPEKKEKLKNLIKKGKLLVGPWYVLPDVNYLHGESFIRNLLLGHKIANEFGRVMKVGYFPSSWGQCSQMPQILQGFNIDNVIFYRGINKDVAPKSNYFWESEDGSKVLGFRLTDYARANFFYYVFRPVVHNRGMDKMNYHWGDSGYPFMICDNKSTSCFQLEMHEGKFDKNKIIDCLIELEEKDIKETTTKHALAIQCDDQLFSYEKEPEIIELANKALKKKNQIIHSSLPIYVSQVKHELKKNNLFSSLPILKGEMRHFLREGVWTDLINDIVASRIDLKKRLREVEFALIKWAEQFSCFALLLKATYPNKLLARAWKLLLENQSHDSIGGCSMDFIHRENMIRFDKVEEIANSLTQESLRYIYKKIDLSSFEKTDILYIVFNPLSVSSTEVVEATLDIEENEPETFSIIDPENSQEVEMQIVKKTPFLAVFQNPIELPLRMKCKRFNIRFFANNIPALGYKVFKIEKKRQNKENKKLIASKNKLENEYIEVEINSNGTFNLKDKINNKMYINLHYFEDRGDIGDPWIQKYPENDKIISSLNFPAEIILLENGPLYAAFKVKIKMKIPYSVTSDRKSRTKKKVNYPITSIIALKKQEKYVHIKTIIENIAYNHYLRVMFPTYLTSAQYSYAESLYDVVKRKISVPNGTGWKEVPSGKFPQLNFVDLTDGDFGLAVLNKGLPQYEIIDTKERIIALTLLRSFTYWNSIRLAYYPDQIDSQMIGKYTCEYALYPHRGLWNDAEVLSLAYKFNLPLKVCQCAPCKEGYLKQNLSFLKLNSSKIIIGAIKKAEKRKSIIIRLINPTDEDISTSFTLFKKIKYSYLLNMNEKRISSLNFNKNTLFFEILHKKILTLEVVI